MAETTNGIYYPNNYNSIADVPEDMKKIAESIDMKIAELKLNETNLKEDIQKNTNNISELREEQMTQNTELNKLKTKLKRYENSNITGIVEDKNISIKDSSDLPLKSFNVVGNMEQETYKDINKFNKVDFARQNSEYYSYDNKTGLRVLKADGRAFDEIEYITSLKPNTTHYIKVENISNLSSMQLFEYSSTSSYIKANTLTENGTITTSNNCSYVKIKFLSNTYPINIGHVIISEEDVPYQPIESPSLDYPSEVRVCGDNVNLFNKLLMTGTANINFIDLKLKANTYYTFSSNIPKTYDNANAYIFATTKEHGHTTAGNGIWEGQTRTILSDNEGYISLAYRKDNNIDSFMDYDYKIEEGKKSTPWSPYEQGSISIEKSNKNLAIIEQGDIFDNSGGEANNRSNVVRTNFIHFNSSKKLTVSFNTSLETRYRNYYLYDKDKKFIKTMYGYTNGQTISTNLVDVSFVRFKINGPTDGNMTIEDIDFQAEVGEQPTGIMPHQGKTYVIPTQAPFYEEDTFIIKDGKRYEKHNWKEKELNGTENWQIASSVMENTSRFYFNDNEVINSKKDVDNEIYVKSNTFKCATFNEIYTTNITDKNLISNYNNSQNSGGRIIVRIDSDYASTVEELKTLLSGKYQAGTPVYIIYKLATPTLIPCTEEQNTILDEIEEDGTYKNVTYYYSTDEVEPTMKVGYYKDMETEHNRLQAQIDDIKTLLSTSKTSAMLLDNLENDLVEEV